MGVHLLLACGGKNKDRETLPALGKGMHRIKQPAVVPGTRKKHLCATAKTAENLEPGTRIQRVVMFHMGKYLLNSCFGTGNHMKTERDINHRPK